jgi:formylglycine-generating enzyme required for sulfatase activity
VACAVAAALARRSGGDRGPRRAGGDHGDPGAGLGGRVARDSGRTLVLGFSAKGSIPVSRPAVAHPPEPLCFAAKLRNAGSVKRLLVLFALVSCGHDVPARAPPLRAEASTSADAALHTGTCSSDMVHVPGGTFSMGSPDTIGDAREHPQHRVSLSAYCIDKTEVTVAAYARCVASSECTRARAPARFTGYGDFFNAMRAERQDHPVNGVNWNQAQAYCDAMHKRLPTEAEWEYAARGTDGRTFPWGNDAPGAKRLNACGGECRELGKSLGDEWPVMYEDSDGWGATAPVGSFPDGASPFGALDMAGNLLEWTADWLGPYAADASANPHGATDGSYRVIRGGQWYNHDVGLVRAAYRSGAEPAISDTFIGFRCARGD